MSKDETEMRILKKGTTDSISGKSKISYHIGATPNNEIHFRVHSNANGGFFSREWVSLKDILDVLGEVPKGQAISSFVLQPLFRGKSVNTPAFLVSALASEQLLRLLRGKKRGHEILDPEAFMARMEKLTSVKAKGPIKKKSAGSTRKATTKKAAIKKKAMSRRKTA